jgi:hydroxymethylbilane synthase
MPGRVPPSLGAGGASRWLGCGARRYDGPMNSPVIIATRESRLALWQAEHVRAVLTQRLGLQVQLLGMTTRGDQILDRSLSKVGGKGLFVKELETALEEGRAHLAVHSLKDVPMDLPEGFALAAIWEREDPRDAFVSSRYADWRELPHGACVLAQARRRRCGWLRRHRARRCGFDAIGLGRAHPLAF